VAWQLDVQAVHVRTITPLVLITYRVN
jgi:hypothetical protein